MMTDHPSTAASAGPWNTLWHSLRRRWRIVALCGVMALGVGTIIAACTNPQYVAKAKVRLINDHPSFASNDARQALEDAATIRSQLYVFHSQRVLSAVCEQLNLPQRWHVSQGAAIAHLNDAVNIKRTLDAAIVEVQANDLDSQLASDISNAIIDAYSTEVSRPRREQSNLMLARLAEQRREQDQQLIQAEEQVQQLRQQLGMSIGETQPSDASLNAWRQIATSAQTEKFDAEFRISTIEHSNRDPMIALELAEPIDIMAKNLAMKLSEAQIKLASDDQRFGADHPVVQQSKQNYELTLAAAKDHVSQIIELAQTERSAAESRAAMAKQRMADEEENLAASSARYTQFVLAQQREDEQRQLSRQLSDLSSKLAMDLKLSGPSVEVIEPAMAASAPSVGTPVQIHLIAMLVGLGLGTMLCMCIDRFDTSIYEPDDIAQQLGMPILGAVGKNRVLVGGHKIGADVESYRMIRNAVDFAAHTVRTVCISGARSGEGASITAANLAWAWAEHGARVMVIDCNFSNPSIHGMFWLSNDRGLSDFIAVGKPLDELLTPSSVANVWVLCAGKYGCTKNHTPTISPQQLNELLMWAKSHADIVLFDTAPVLESSDTAMIARQADVSVMVVRRNNAPARELRRCVHALRSCGAHLLGIVLTNTRPGSAWEPMPLRSMRMMDESSATDHAELQRRNKYAA